MDIEQGLSAGVSALSLTVPDKALERLLAYAALLQKWNAAYNLVANADSKEVLHTHLLDSLAVLPSLNGDRVLDVGSGAGLPGIPLAIVDSRRSFHMLDTNGKKTRFMRQALIELELPNAQVLQTRVEKYQPDENYPCVISRAFSPLPQAMKILPNLCADGGTVLLMCGQLPASLEVPAGLSQESIKRLDVPGLDAQRHLITLRKN